MARYFREGNDLIGLEIALHIRESDRGDIGLSNYERATIGRPRSDLPYSVFVDNKLVLPANSSVPFELCPITIPEYESFLKGLESAAAKAVLESMYSKIAWRAGGILNEWQESRYASRLCNP